MVIDLFLHVRVPPSEARPLRDGIELYCKANGGELVDYSLTMPTPEACPECGRPMDWDPVLGAFACPHDEG